MTPRDRLIKETFHKDKKCIELHPSIEYHIVMIIPKAQITQDVCLNQAKLEERPLISPEEAKELSNIFKIFANDNRLRLLHAMARAGEIRVVDLAAALEMKVQAVSNQLQRLADKGFVEAKREGQNFFYRIKNPCLPGILEFGLCLLGATRKRPE
jgi:ArsR family transcriptional regulator, lead/cadmium/zinc/bismuth-responsive transcriptional repressor